eukprot:TRINITY_DN68811_c0_g1_i1.p1 TRINITY_DN68811_c0_g1~~TRINITY_DN68811_c0_g1_i1.p1  ORF type:complete len:317 (+),score=45.41 TRINITY_DN68811_c0_g1_i1:89-952(+)
MACKSWVWQHDLRSADSFAQRLQHTTLSKKGLHANEPLIASGISTGTGSAEHVEETIVKAHYKKGFRSIREGLDPADFWVSHWIPADLPDFAPTDDARLRLSSYRASLLERLRTKASQLSEVIQRDWNKTSDAIADEVDIAEATAVIQGAFGSDRAWFEASQRCQFNPTKQYSDNFCAERKIRHNWRSTVEGLEAVCHVCNHKPAKACSGCSSTWYCSRACQKSDWKRHKPECVAPSATSGEAVSEHAPLANAIFEQMFGPASHEDSQDQQLLNMLQGFMSAASRAS